MKIYVSMITLNEQEYIEAAIKSCEFAEKIVIVDGGSEDDTVEVLNNVKISNKLFVEFYPWENHFGNQRQKALDMVPPDCDWWLRIDSDEVFPELFQWNIVALLESLPEEIVAARIKQLNLLTETEYSANRGGWETWPRIFRNIRLLDDSSAWRWTGQVHEHCQLMTRDGLVDPVKVANLNLTVIHRGWLDGGRRQDREDLYSGIAGSGVTKRGDLTERRHVIREVPPIFGL